MSRPAAIAGHLVNLKNVGVHKSVALTIHVPEELAPSVIEAFGWPTMANPVSVAVARIEVQPALPEEPKQIEAPKKKWEEMGPAQQAGIRCNDPLFHQYISERAPKSWAGLVSASSGDYVEAAARYVRNECGITSRGELSRRGDSAERWAHIDDDFFRWERGMR